MNQVTTMAPTTLQVPDDGPDWLRTLRREAAARFQVAGMPARKDEAWRNTDAARFTPAPTDRDGSADVEVPSLDGIGLRAVLVDGVFRPDLSTLDLPKGIEVLSLREAADADREEVRVHLEATRPEDTADGLADANTASFLDGLFINVHPDTTVEAPLHIIHLRTGGHAVPRVLVHVQKGAALSVVEQTLGAGTTNALTELHAHDRSTVHHVALQEQDLDADHLHTVRATAERDATVRTHTLHFGAANSRTTLTATLRGEGSSADLQGLMLAAGKQRMDTWSRVDHAVPHATSHQLVKAVLDDEARTGFTGNVLVRHGAIGTDSKQENRNLLLSRGALADATPQLEIHADDVQCSHGSTVGQLDDDQLFFLRSRGIGHDDAVALLTKAFAAQVVETIPLDAVRSHVDARIDAWFDREATS